MVSKDEILVHSYEQNAKSGDTFTVEEFSLNRDGNRYIGLRELGDGVKETPWGDYTKRTVILTDPNDSDGDGIPDVSDLTPLDISKPEITAQPQNRKAEPGESVTFAVSASGTESVSYQ